MKPRKTYWVAEAIHGWRDEAEIKGRSDPAELRSVIQGVRDRDSRGLMIFTVLASEWVFRLKKIGKAEDEAVLGHVEHGLRQIVPHDLSNLVTEALAPLIKSALRREGRILVAFGPFSDQRPELLYYPHPFAEPRYRGYKPRHQVRARPGPLACLAPWIAAAASEKLLAARGIKSRLLSLDLVNALMCRAATIDSNDYGKHKRRLSREALDEYCQELKKAYARMRSLTANPAAEPEANIDGMLRSLGPGGLFSFEDTLVKKLLTTYGSDRRRGKHKETVKGSRRAPMQHT